ncbi:MAG: hypothetical protein WDM85_00055 [Caulobacteraceae bacterium]
MKLYQTYTSPFPTRVRLVLYAKGLSPQIIEPPGFHATVESRATTTTSTRSAECRRWSPTTAAPCRNPR